MRLNFEEFKNDRIYDHCIIGAGPAGITLALELADKGKNILLLEGGTDEISEGSQEIYDGTVSGDPYLDLSSSRLRFFGGSSNHWAGWCRTLDSYDFKNKGGIETEWPIEKADLDGYFDRAANILELAPLQTDQLYGNSGLKIVDFTYSPPVRFLDKYFDRVSNHSNITLVLGANVTSLKTDGFRITEAIIESYFGKSQNVRAGYYLLATGGIENNRLLLWSNRLSDGKLVKNDSTLGRYWMDHPDFTLGSAIVHYSVLEPPEGETTCFIAPSEQMIIKEGILNCCLRIDRFNYEGSKKLIGDLACVAPKLGRAVLGMFNKNLTCGYQLRASWEQQPVSSNFIELDEKKDRFGMPRVKLNYRKTDLDFKTIKKTALRFADYLAETDQGRVLFNNWFINEKGLPFNDNIAGAHHMGGTRMADKPDKGIVDKNLKLFGQDNLYIAGSSVFPSSGFANPTLTIVQLALRLSDHLLKLV
ncbi:MAG: GMC family oxidoreductase [Kordiimonadaceae bacterium]|nr:GMC family oxidoreductase [Kordiimonadaceae bacterium]